MVRTRSKVALFFTPLLALAAAAGCSDTDPKYGPPQGIRGREIDFGLDAGDNTPVPEAGPSTKSATVLFAELFVTLTDTTEAKGSPCVPCHGTTQAPVFMAATAEETRTKFKANGYEKLTTSRFYLKGAHTGKELKPAQKTLTQQWSAAEAAGGGAATGDGG